MALDGGIALLAWAESGPTSGRIYCARTLDRGQSWERPRALGSTLVGLPTPPRVLLGDRTEVYVAWQIATSRSTTSVVLAPSRDSGSRFSEIVLERPTGISTGIVDLEGLATATPVAAAADDAGNVYFSWVETEVGSARLGFDRIGNHGRNPVHPQHGLDLQTGFDVGFPANAIPAPVPYLEADSFGHLCLLWNAGHTLYVAASPFNGDSGWRVSSF